jgi:hypothetical protein
MGELEFVWLADVDQRELFAGLETPLDFLRRDFEWLRQNSLSSHITGLGRVARSFRKPECAWLMTTLRSTRVTVDGTISTVCNMSLAKRCCVHSRGCAAS